jgi:hypothetical protein
MMKKTKPESPLPSEIVNFETLFYDFESCTLKKRQKQKLKSGSLCE